MLHYTCDCCKRPIDSENSVRYVVRLEVYASLDPVEEDMNDDRDHLLEIHDILEQLEDNENELIGDEVYHHERYDLCSDCRRNFVKNPLGRPVSHQFDFSQN
ncbi:MAG: hypothetical protein KDA57_12850 [Planctomycetales bacterium]|nr:hypothetical protein [Planctomycetales bacterium]